VAPAGDVDGDGFADVIVGDWSSNFAIVYTGGMNGITGATGTTAPLMVPSTPTSFGFAVGGGGDINGDGLSDVVVTDNGRHAVYVYTDLSSLPSGSVTAPSGSMGFGQGVFVVGDVNNDLLSEYIVGTQGSNDAYVYLGRATAPASTLLQQLTGSSGFGLPVAMLWRGR
jgi:hypothetical protein